MRLVLSDVDKVKVTLYLLRREVVSLQRSADERGISFTHALRIAIWNFLELLAYQRAGNKILLEHRNGTFSLVTIRD